MAPLGSAGSPFGNGRCSSACRSGPHPASACHGATIRSAISIDPPSRRPPNRRPRRSCQEATDDEYPSGFLTRGACRCPLDDVRLASLRRGLPVKSDITIRRRAGSAPGSAGFLPRPGRAALPASAPGAPVRRCADAGAPAHHRHHAAGMAAAPGAVEPWKARLLGGSATVPFLSDVEVHVRFLVALPLLIAAELVVHRRMRSVVKRLPGTPFDSGKRQGAIRCRHRVGAQAAQFGARRGAADRLGVCRRYPDHLAPLRAARRGDVVRGTVRGRFEALARRDVVWLREPADLPVPAVPLVFPTV